MDILGVFLVLSSILCGKRKVAKGKQLSDYSKAADSLFVYRY